MSLTKEAFVFGREQNHTFLRDDQGRIKHELVSLVTAKPKKWEYILLSRTVADQVSDSLREDKYTKFKEIVT